MTRTTAVLIGLGTLALAVSFSSKSSPMPKPPSPPSPGPPTPRPTVNPANGNPISTFGAAPALTQDSMVALIQEAGFTGAAISKALAIALRESGWHPEAVVDTRGMTPAQLKAYWGKPAAQELSVGLWQINVLSSPQYDVELLQDPTYAAQAAFELSKGGTNWGPWGG